MMLGICLTWVVIHCVCLISLESDLQKCLEFTAASESTGTMLCIYNFVYYAKYSEKSGPRHPIFVDKFTLIFM